MNKTTLMAIGVVVVIIIIVIVGVLTTRGPVDWNEEANLLIIGQITPAANFALVPDQNQTFNLIFNKPVDLDSLVIELSQTDGVTGEVKAVNFSVAKVSDMVVDVLTTNPIEPVSRYDLVIKDKNTGRKIEKVSYLSDDILATPIPSNNPSLRNYLPRETSSYQLRFDEKRNLYVFNFIFNPNSNETVEEQYNRAKNEATGFIQSVGVDVNSIVIEWRYN